MTLCNGILKRFKILKQKKQFQHDVKEFIGTARAVGKTVSM